MTFSRLTALLLVLSACNLALMVPGGLVETRVFPDYSVAVLAAFNIFLTVLGLGSLILAWQVWRNGASGPLAPAAGLAFAAVYLADLLVIFPVSPTPMPPLLTSLETIGTVLGISLCGVGLRAMSSGDRPAAEQSRLSVGTLILLAGVAAGIVTFATLAAK